MKDALYKRRLSFLFVLIILMGTNDSSPGGTYGCSIFFFMVSMMIVGLFFLGELFLPMPFFFFYCLLVLPLLLCKCLVVSLLFFLKFPLFVFRMFMSSNPG